MSTRGLLSFHFQGQNYVTYNHSDSYPKALGAWICLFAQEHLNSKASIKSFGQKLQALEWVDGFGQRDTAQLQGGALLEAIAKGKVQRIARDNRAFRLCMDCEFAYILDLDKDVMEFWDLVAGEQVETFTLDSLSLCAVDVMECERRH